MDPLLTGNASCYCPAQPVAGVDVKAEGLLPLPFAHWPLPAARCNLPVRAWAVLLAHHSSITANFCTSSICMLIPASFHFLMVHTMLWPSP